MEKFEFKSSIKHASNQHPRVKALIEKLGMVMPSTHTALFTTAFASLDEPNGNGVRLHSKVGESVNQMIGAQANLEHEGRGFVTGVILDSWLEENGEIHIIFSFAKNIYEKEYVQALEKMANNDFSVSFELLADTKDIEKLEDSTILLHSVDWQGVGVLIEAPPAYKYANVYEVATLYKSRAESCKELVFASQIIEQCNEILKTKTEGEKSMTEEQMKIISDLRAELGDLVADVSDEELLNEEKVNLLRASVKPVEAKEEEVKAEEETPKEEKEEIQAEMKSVTKEVYLTTVTYKDDGSDEISSEKEIVYTWTDSEGNSQTETKKESSEIVYMYSTQAKSEAETKIAELEANIKVLDEKLLASEAKVASFVAEKEAQAKAELDAKLEAIKAELKDNPYVQNFTDEDFLNEEKVEVAKIKKQNDDLKAENASLKPLVKVEASLQNNDLPTGHDTEPVETMSFRKAVKGKLVK